MEISGCVLYRRFADLKIPNLHQEKILTRNDITVIRRNVNNIVADPQLVSGLSIYNLFKDLSDGLPIPQSKTVNRHMVAK
jgi:hypothetical protein